MMIIPVMLPVLLLLFGQVLTTPLDKKKVDLTYVIDETIPHWPGNNGFSMKVSRERTENFTAQSEIMETPTHIGTHIDAPNHFIESGLSVDQISEERLSGPAIVVDVQNQTLNNDDYGVTVQDLTSWEEDNGRIPDKSFVLLRTGFARYWNDKKRYLGTDTKDVSLLRFPGLSGEAAEWLVKERDILGVGLDTTSLDRGRAADNPAAHLAILGANNIAIENLANLDQLPATGIYLEIFPMKLKGASGAPARVTAYY